MRRYLVSSGLDFKEVTVMVTLADSKSILAYFPGRRMAEKAARALNDEGFDEMEITRVSRYPGDQTQHITNPVTGDIASLATLTLGVDIENNSEEILLTTDPSASGQASAGGTADGQAFLLVVVTDPARHEQAAEILKQHGAYI